MVAKNDVTGDSIQTKNTSDAYRDNYDRIFRKDKRAEEDAIIEDEEFKRLEEQQKTGLPCRIRTCVMLDPKSSAIPDQANER